MAALPTISVRVAVEGLEEFEHACYRAAAAAQHLGVCWRLDAKARAVRRQVLREIRTKFEALRVSVAER